MAALPLAHSAKAGGAAQSYPAHVRSVRSGAAANGVAMLAAARRDCPELVAALYLAGDLHDLGKLASEIQRVLDGRDRGPLPWDHVDAGVAQAMALRAELSAWLIRAHHAPGLPSEVRHFGQSRPDGRPLRGRRNDEDAWTKHKAQIEHTDRHLASFVAQHESLLGPIDGQPMAARHGLTMRLALSCLVDADHGDTARHASGIEPGSAAEPRWAERLAQLDRHVATKSAIGGDSRRNLMRAAFYADCREHMTDAPIVACEGPVGIGKTTAVTAYLLRRAADEGLRRLVVIAPYTNILTQTANTLRAALVLPGEDPDMVVVEHHHRADFEDVGTRELAALWRAPVVVTTAVQLFGTLSSNRPAALRKLHALPGSAIFIDEAHAALPTPLWRQNWLWLRELAHDWRCRIVLASGSPSKFWQHDRIVPEPCDLPDLLDPIRAAEAFAFERGRVRYRTQGRLESPDDLVDRVLAEPGPRVVVMNTVQSAAVVARTMRSRGRDTMHLSTALAPRDRATILAEVSRRLADTGDCDWTLVATSCIEAGVDLSFRSGFRERFSVASLIQLGGRVNRHGEYPNGGTVWDFTIDTGGGITAHPAATGPAAQVKYLFRDGGARFDDPAVTPGDLVTEAMAGELRDHGAVGRKLADAEKARDYPTVEEEGRVIKADTRTVVVDPGLRERLRRGELVDFRALLDGSVQLWGTKIESLKLREFEHRPGLYDWPHPYDPAFLGVMAGILPLADLL